MTGVTIEQSGSESAGVTGSHAPPKKTRREAPSTTMRNFVVGEGHRAPGHSMPPRAPSSKSGPKRVRRTTEAPIRAAALPP